MEALYEARIKTRIRSLVREMLLCCVLAALMCALIGDTSLSWQRDPVDTIFGLAMLGLLLGPPVWLAYRVIRFALGPSATLRLYRR